MDEMSLFVFDKDGTLIQRRYGALGRRIPPTRPEHQKLRPFVHEKLAELRGKGALLAIASNVNLVAFGALSMEQARELVEDCARKVGGVHATRFSPFDPRARLLSWLPGRRNSFMRDDPSRKPHPGMLLDLMAELGQSPGDTTMIGDEKLDREAAAAAGVRFVAADAFFCE
jgi:HAD superfamily hydrolase (TIGR01662 family)